jgi:hypothetical protein
VVKPSSSQLFQHVFGDLFACLGVDFTGLHVDDVLGQILAVQVIVGHGQGFDARFSQPALDLAGSDLAAGSTITSPVSALIRSRQAFMPFRRAPDQTATPAALAVWVMSTCL